MELLQSGDYFAFMLRLWRESDERPWRATLQNPHTGEQLNFATFEQLVNFLAEKTGNSGAGD